MPDSRPLPARVRDTIARRELLPDGAEVLCAVSGGADSVALLRVLLDLAPAHGYRVRAAHFDHGLRDGSAEEARFVRELAAAWDVPCAVERWADPITGEAAAREARYAFLRRAAAGPGSGPGDEDPAAIAVGHQADDRAETLLAQLVRGAGPRGLSLPRARREDGVIRPLYDVTAEQIRAFLREQNVRWLEDPTNRDGTNLRARLREDVLPVLRRENPSLSRTLGRTADLLGWISDYLDRQAADALARLLREETPGGITLAGLPGPAYDPVVLVSVLREAAVRTGGNPAEIGLEALESAAGAWRRGEPLAADLAGGLHLRVGPDGLWIGREPGATVALRPVEVPVPGQVRLDELGARLVTRWDGVPQDVRGASSAGVAWLDAARIRGDLRVRPRRAGDRYRPLGLVGSVKVQDLLVDRKVPRHRRDAVPIVEDAEGIVWIPGFRVDARARITEETQKALCLEWTGWMPSSGPPRGGPGREERNPQP